MSGIKYINRSTCQIAQVISILKIKYRMTTNFLAINANIWRLAKNLQLAEF